MKNYILIALASISLIACSEDESTDETGNMDDTEVTLIGTWNVVEFTMQQALDVNGDGTASEDLLDEASCYINELTFTDEGSYAIRTSNLEFVQLGGGDFTVECNGTDTEVGTYILDGTTLTTDEGTTDEIEATIELSGNNLTVFGSDDDFGDVVIVYEKAEE